MKIKTKKKNSDGIVRLETSGKIKEIIINEDFLKPKSANIAVCFRGKSSSGIIELTPLEIENIYQEVISKANLLGNVKIMKFEK
ncbi:hypothetical protein K9L16_02715 [Candidatus Pacearchaeota archaeon]|nr:hypothetical protein [Candidatus Pacearchaeota archaeon]